MASRRPTRPSTSHDTDLAPVVGTNLKRLRAERGLSLEKLAPGTTENLVVAKGAVKIHSKGETHRLAPGDAIHFEADTPHVYKNPGNADAVLYLVMTYAEQVR